VLLADIQYDAVELLTILGEMHVIAIVQRCLFELVQVVPEVFEAVLFYLLYMLAKFFKVAEVFYRRVAHDGREQGHQVAALGLARVLQGRMGIFEKSVTGLFQTGASVTACLGR
jgi:hypothetical protein